MGYLAPVDAPVSCDWACHLDRDPPSSEPGTDFACAYGTLLEAADSGTVVDVKHSNSAATGRYVTIALDDGRTVRYLHLADVWVAIGQRLIRGQVFGLSGASGYGTDWYYGAHVHVTLWPGPIWAHPTIDFELYIDAPAPPEPSQPRRDTVGSIIAARDQGGHTFYFEGGYVKHLANAQEVQAMVWSMGDVRVNQFDNADFQRAIYNYGLEEFTMADVISRATVPDGPGGFLVASWRDVRDVPGASPGPAQLVTPAWIAGFFLGLIGLVEVVRLVVDLLT